MNRAAMDFLRTVLTVFEDTGDDPLVSAVSQNGLADGVRTLQGRYRTGGGSDFRTDAERYAYIRYRLPATFSVMMAVLDHWRLLGGQDLTAIQAHLDLGAGPGTVSLALWAQGLTPTVTHTVEQDAAMASMARRLLDQDPQGVYTHHRQSLVDFFKKTACDKTGYWYDLITASYALSELSSPELRDVVRGLCDLMDGYAIVVEPGTPKGFDTIKHVRTAMLDMGAHVLAPCPHGGPCPMVSGDWCHFSVRLPRDAIHRALKGGGLAYEDEKFSYAVFAAPGKIKDAAHPRYPSRVIKKPRIPSGHVILDLCQEDGTLGREIISARDKKQYKAAKKTQWGDRWPSLF